MQDFRRFLQYLSPHRVAFAVALVAMVFNALFEAATFALIVPIIDQALGTGARAETLFSLQKWIPQNDWLASWGTISLLLVFFTVGAGISEYFSTYLMAKIGQSAVLRMRRELYDHLLKQSASFFERHRTNFLVTRLVTNAAAIEHSVSVLLRDILRESFMLVVFISTAFYYNWRLMLGALVLAPVIALLTTKFSKSLRKFAEESFEGTKILSDTAQETLTNYPIVKAYRAEEREKLRFSEIAAGIARANRRSGRILALSPPIITLIGMLAVITLMFFGYREINLGYMQASQFFTFLVVLLRSYDPMRKISRQHNQLTQTLAAARDVWTVMDENEVLPEKPNAVKLKPLADKISLEQVSFSYQTDDKPILRGIDLEIPAGSVVALVGESGGGKSSLIKLLQRLYDPSAGTILWDGTDLRDADLKTLKSHTALVTQETVLFNDTVRYNIAYGRPEATEEQITEAARIAFAHDFIRELPNGYETIVGERGVFLSGGQRQRIAIARAVLTDAPVLILDEATSALDAESERLVQKALSNLMQNRTSVVIAHRLSTVRRANKIVVMERGRIVETGTHAELLQKGGTYKRLYELQFLEDEISEQALASGEQ